MDKIHEADLDIHNLQEQERGSKHLIVRNIVVNKKGRERERGLEDLLRLLRMLLTIDQYSHTCVWKRRRLEERQLKKE